MPTDISRYMPNQVPGVLYAVNTFGRAGSDFLFDIVLLILIVAGYNIIASLAKAIILNKGNWKEKPDSKLMYSYTSGSGFFQWSLIYKDAHKILFDKKWSKFSFARLAYRLGNYTNSSKTILFLTTLVYLPLVILGSGEMAVRRTVGVIIFLAFNIVYSTVLFGLWIINCILTPLFYLIDKIAQVPQHCPNCYSVVNRLPLLECPYCGTQHVDLYPGKSGLLFAKCSCGHFIPCSSLTKRKKLKAYCPKCVQVLPSSNIKALTIQIVGGNKSGKTAFIAAFQHQYVDILNKSNTRSVSIFPENDFIDLERMYSTGEPKKSSTKDVCAYYVIHNKSIRDDGIIIYETPDEVILDESYERNPLYFAYSDGIVILIDPFSVSSEKNYNTSMSVKDPISFSDDSTEDIIVRFINKYSEVTGRASKRMSDIPVAIVITKTDLYSVKKRIGAVKIKSEFAANPLQYSSIEDARNKICRKYLSDIGLLNVLNNIESVFSKVAFFPVSSIGHAVDGSPFDPQNVISPIEWLAEQCHSDVDGLLKQVEENVK